jgi:hypothetical protein
VSAEGGVGVGVAFVPSHSLTKARKGEYNREKGDFHEVFSIVDAISFCGERLQAFGHRSRE